ncbi:angiopoietin-2-like [Pelodytes ibericus]
MKWALRQDVLLLSLLCYVVPVYSQGSDILVNSHLLSADDTNKIINKRETVFFRDCSEILFKSKASATDGLYIIQPASDPIVVLCIMQEGGITVIQHITANTSLDFDRPWKDYKFGFGNVLGDHWLGNEYMHQLTQPPGHQRLSIKLVTMEGEIKWGVYDPVLIESEKDGYRLRLGLYHGSASDALAHETDAYMHDNQRFTTRDHDNDNYFLNCALLEYQGIPGGGWWYDACAGANLNRRNVIYWQNDCNKEKPCKYASMMLQPTVRMGCEHTGECPPYVPGARCLSNPGKDFCDTSNECQKNLKCCFNGCLWLCMRPLGGSLGPPFHRPNPIHDPFRPPFFYPPYKPIPRPPEVPHPIPRPIHKPPIWDPIPDVPFPDEPFHDHLSGGSLSQLNPWSSNTFVQIRVVTSHLGLGVLATKREV